MRSAYSAGRLSSMAVKSGMALIMLAMALLLLPLRWLGAAILAATGHEICHWIAVKLCGGQIHRLSVGPWGAELKVTGLNIWQELICALAGPAGGMLLLGMGHILPRTALCAGLQSLYNLLPIYPLDGGRALRCLCNLLIPGRAGEQVCDAVQFLCLIGIGILGVYGTFFLKLGLLPLILSATLIAKGKRPCKTAFFSLQ